MIDTELTEQTAEPFMRFFRYAIYYTLPPGPLSDFMAAWLGWNASTGEKLDPPDVEGLPMPAHDITARPRKYGFHATLKAPFRLASNASFDALHDSFASFCATVAPVSVEGLRLQHLGSFLALTADGDVASLNDLAASAVREFDPFRAPLTEDDMKRRQARRLTERQKAHLLRWGYPHVMEDFRFHMTVSGRLAPETAETTRHALAHRITPLLPRPFLIDALTLCGEDDAGLFHNLIRLPLTGTAAAQSAAR